LAKEPELYYKVIAIVKEVRGCPYYKVGDTIIYEEPEISKDSSGKLCVWALQALIPYFVAACRKTPKEDWINVLHDVQCPDPTRSVVFELKREPLK